MVIQKGEPEIYFITTGLMITTNETILKTCEDNKEKEFWIIKFIIVKTIHMHWKCLNGRKEIINELEDMYN